jgi:hypothetical protein
MRIDRTGELVQVADSEHRWEPTTPSIWNEHRTQSYKNDPICHPCGGLMTRWNDTVGTTTVRFVGCPSCSRIIMKFLLATGTYFFKTELA